MAVPLNKWFGFFFLIYCFLLLLGTLWPLDFQAGGPYLIIKLKGVEWIPFDYLCPRCGIDYKDYLLNFFMFIPFGFLLSSLMMRDKPNLHLALRTTLYGFLFSLSIESSQIFLPSRRTQASDILFNCIGTMVGSAVLFPFFRFTREDEVRRDEIP
jgi:glycopeptide antibiotics resistance protein